MLGLMQDYPLTVNSIFRRADGIWRDRTIATRTVTGIERIDVGEANRRTRKLAGGIESLGLSPDARVGSFAWNTARHLHLYFAVPGTGRILHTINIRYFADQIGYCIEHAEDEAIFVDRSLLPVLAPRLAELSTVKHIIVMDDGASTELPDDSRIVRYEELVDGADELDFVEMVSDEQQAAALCYTTGTTGNPKGVLYSHRSTWLHANAGLSAAGSALTDSDNAMPVVPMFHAMAWGLPYTAMMAGSSLTMPGPDLSPKALLELIASEKVTYAAGVPTIWMGMLPLVDGYDISSINRMMCGGSAVPRALSEGWREKTGIPITQGWGMTETSPVASMSTLRKEFIDGDEELRADARAMAGIPLVGVELRIADPETGELQPWDGEATGEVQARGPWVTRQYYRTDEPGEQFSADGWLRTGDVGSISPLGYLRLVDRTKDLVKSGGEWISTIDLENVIMSNPKVAEAAVIAIPHPKWMERPLACVVVKPGEELTKQEVLDYVAERVAKWQVPDDVLFIDEVPKTSVGKFSKKTLREQFTDYQWPTVAE